LLHFIFQDVHSTTPRHSGSVGTILVLILDDSAYIDLPLFDVYKQEFYTKMNLLGEITFEDHRYDLLLRQITNRLCLENLLILKQMSYKE
jgi:hypothetical protein